MSENTANSTNKSNTNSKMKKFALLLLMLILLLIPTGFWYGIIKDRESYKNEAVRSVASAWGDVQIFGSPTLSFTQPKDKTTETINLTLNHYNTDIKITTETRHKGIYKVPVYIADVKIKGDFTNNYYDDTGTAVTLSAVRRPAKRRQASVHFSPIIWIEIFRKENFFLNSSFLTPNP